MENEIGLSRARWTFTVSFEQDPISKKVFGAGRKDEKGRKLALRTCGVFLQTDVVLILLLAFLDRFTWQH